MTSSERALLERMKDEKNCKLSCISKERRPNADSLEEIENITSAMIKQQRNNFSFLINNEPQQRF